MSESESRQGMDDVLVSLRRMMGGADDADRKSSASRTAEDGADDEPLVLTDALAEAEPEPLTLDDLAEDDEVLTLSDLDAGEAADEPIDLGTVSGEADDEGAGAVPGEDADHAGPAAADEDAVTDEDGLAPPAGEGQRTGAAEDVSGDETSPDAMMPSEGGEAGDSPVAALPARLGAGDEAADTALPTDRAALEELVRKVIRDELVEGEIGHNISRNVMRLIREEVERILAHRGL